MGGQLGRFRCVNAVVREIFGSAEVPIPGAGHAKQRRKKSLVLGLINKSQKGSDIGYIDPYCRALSQVYPTAFQAPIASHHGVGGVTERANRMMCHFYACITPIHRSAVTFAYSYKR